MGYCKARRLKQQTITVPDYISVIVENTDTII